MKHVKIILGGPAGGMTLGATDGNAGSEGLSFSLNSTLLMAVDMEGVSTGQNEEDVVQPLN